jgi:predicted dehydrogenase
VSVCSPTALHAAHLRGALALAPKLIFCEKPVTLSLPETESVVAGCRAAGVLLAVNHTRRWAPDVIRLRDALRDRVWGAVRSITGVYSKGVLNNGAHMIDLLHFLVGPVRVIAAGTPVADFWDDDPSIPAMLETENGVAVHLSVGHAADYALFELTIVTEFGVITMEAGGLRWRVRRADASADFPGYHAVGAGSFADGEYAHAMSNAVANLRRAIDFGEPLASDGESACLAQRVCADIRMKSHV